MKKYLRNITVGTALVLVAGSCTGNFEEYNTCLLYTSSSHAVTNGNDIAKNVLYNIYPKIRKQSQWQSQLQ